ncbi:MAG: trehalose-phosphatase [Burkholderiaceae bacterium]|nr:trehalose-phosphatase [Burkholderiaceae bacterium]
MRNLFTPAGEADLAATIARRPLLAFDFDGTLSPIVTRPTDARVPIGTLRRLKSLAHRLPLAVISGRAVDDLRHRLGFEPTYLVGNHGAEDPALTHRPELSAALDGFRARVLEMDAELRHVGVQVEDKGPSMALHYRLATDRGAAMDAIGRALDACAPGLHVFGGKMVINVVSSAADDKAAALHRIARRAGVHAVVYFGDDVNDETVFAAREPHWLTIRVGADAPESAARYFIGSTREMPRLLDRILQLSAASADPH